MVQEMLERLDSGWLVRFTKQLDPIMEETVAITRDAPGQFGVVTQIIFLDGSTMATSPRFSTLDSEVVRTRITELLAAGFQWLAVPR